MRKTKIGVMDFHGSVDITDPCYDKDVWCRMNNVKISEGEYACYVWRHTDKGKYEDGTPYSYLLVGAIGIYRNGDIPRQKDMEEIGSIGVDAGHRFVSAHHAASAGRHTSSSRRLCRYDLSGHQSVSTAGWRAGGTRMLCGIQLGAQPLPRALHRRLHLRCGGHTVLWAISAGKGNRVWKR